MNIEELIPDDWETEKAEVVAEAFYEIGDAIMQRYATEIRALWNERDELRELERARQRQR